MIDKSRQKIVLAQRLALECKHSLVEAAELNASGGEWLVSDEIGNEFAASLVVDEGLDCPVIELRNVESDVLQYRFRVEVVCGPIGEQ
ncbi:MAG: hypothetical protein ABGZ35_06150 [Planctomycetaceae bacterium]